MTKTYQLDFFFTPEFIENPFSFYRQMRQTNPFTKWESKGGTPTWFAFSYEDISAMLKDARFGHQIGKLPKEKLKPFPDAHANVMYLLNNTLLHIEPPEHTRLRKIVGKAFSAVLEKINTEEIVRQTASFLIDRMIEKQTADFVRDFALPLPLMVNAKLLGVEEKDQSRFIQWAECIIQQVDFSNSKQEIRTKGDSIIKDAMDFFKIQIGKRKLQPKNDLISAMLQAEDNGDRLTENEVVTNCILFVGAGHETTISGIANGMLTLINSPEQLNLLYGNHGFIPTAVEEMLRYESPVQLISRYVYEDVDWKGKKIPQGAVMEMILAAGNRDEKYFSEPEKFDITRNPNPHFAFGKGIHICMGQHHARMIMKIAIKTILGKVKHLEIAGIIKRKSTIAFRQLEKFPVKVKAF